MLHPPVRPGALRLAAWVAALSFVSASVSCSSGEERVPVFPVSGRIYVQDKPAEGAFVVFVPENEAAAKHPRPHATVEKDGSFALRTYGERDGAPAGKYIVSVIWPLMVDGREEGDRLQGRYGEKKSKVFATVNAGPNDLEPFKLR